MKEKSKLSDTEKSLALLLLLCVTVLAALAFGSVEMDLNSLIGGILKKDGFQTQTAILYSLRLPRVLAGLLAGVGLSASGVLLQAVTGNGLASPGIIGVNSGAGFAVILLLAFLPSAHRLLPVGAFFGAFGATMLIAFVCSRISFSKSTLILSGVAVNALLNAGISFVCHLDTDILSLYNYFSVGGLNQLFPERLTLPAVIIGLCFVLAIFASAKTDTLCLGDSVALSLGVNVKALRFLCLTLASALAGAVVSFAGLLGFVGLVVPHIAKKISGGKTFALLVNSALIGACLVILSDLLGRTVVAPSEIPVGIVMAFLGAPFLFFLLIKRKGGEKYA